MVLSGYRVFLTVLLLATAACSTLPPEAKKYDSFSAYAEAVFRHQNVLTSRLMMMNSSGTVEDSEALEDAEQAMNEACHLLNEFAEREMEGESMGFLFQRRVQSSVEDCDHKIDKLEAIMAEID